MNFSVRIYYLISDIWIWLFSRECQYSLFSTHLDSFSPSIIVDSYPPIWALFLGLTLLRCNGGWPCVLYTAYWCYVRNFFPRLCVLKLWFSALSVLWGVKAGWGLFMPVLLLRLGGGYACIVFSVWYLLVGLYFTIISAGSQYSFSGITRLLIAIWTNLYIRQTRINAGFFLWL